MKANWIKLCAFLLALLGFSSCGAAKKAAKTAPAEETPAVEQASDDAPVTPKSEAGDDGTVIEVRPAIRVMYGPPPSSFKSR